MADAVALFAPCCVVFLLPGIYLSAAVKNWRWKLIPLTAVFAAELSLVVVSIVNGVTLISSFITANHTILFTLGAVLMLPFAAPAVRRHIWSLPSTMRSPDMSKGGYAGFLAFGVFSGIASSCCTLVLAGVLALSALSQSPVQATIFGFAYVFGMVIPLLIIAVIWDVFDIGRRSWSPKPATLDIFGRRLYINVINLIVVAGFVIMAVLIAIVAFNGEIPTAQQQPLVFIGSRLSRVLAPIGRAGCRLFGALQTEVDEHAHTDAHIGISAEVPVDGAWPWWAEGCVVRVPDQ